MEEGHAGLSPFWQLANEYEVTATAARTNAQLGGMGDLGVIVVVHDKARRFGWQRATALEGQQQPALVAVRRRHGCHKPK
jgi:hypothetical protein